jgi:hypothetical protein
MNTYNFDLQRYSDDGFSTLGIWYEKFVGGKKPLFWGHILEDEHRDKKLAGDTRIWGGKVYEIGIMQELTPLTEKDLNDPRLPFFERHLWIKDVDGFSGVYIHIGNKDGHTEACVLMGDVAGSNMRTIGNDGSLSESVNCYSRFYQYLYPKLKTGDRAFVHVRNEIDLLR